MNIPWNLYYFPRAEPLSLGMLLAEHGARHASTWTEPNLRKWNDNMRALAEQDL